ncbi:MAG: hydrogenase nickel incorporation protein HypB [Gammaproteobacteria bacterium]|nr:hydrogenase nickel incorporation protein HypB [Gammaproteobacteria bacterium]
MCETCGCAINNETESATHRHITIDSPANRESVQVLRDILQANDSQARDNRAKLNEAGVLTINLMSAPGAGKTSLLEATFQLLQPSVRFAAIVGDLATERDADRLREQGISALQITTGNACHLDAHMVHRALHEFELQDLDLLFIENVGNLVCPASFDLGQHLNVTLLSVPEGDDKPAKYPVMFRAADLVLLSKADLLPLMPEFDPLQARAYLQDLASSASIFPVSVRAADGLDRWINWLEESLATQATQIELAGRRQHGVEPSQASALGAHESTD